MGISLKSAAKSGKWTTKDAENLIRLCGGLKPNWDKLLEVSYMSVVGSMMSTLTASWHAKIQQCWSVVDSLEPSWCTDPCGSRYI